MNRTRHRVSVVLLAALQLLAAASVPVVDAMLEVDVASEPLHVEAERATSCGDAHDHVFCQLCRTLTVAGAARNVVDRTSHPAEATIVPDVPLDAGTRLSYLRHTGPIGPRPPPLA